MNTPASKPNTPSSWQFQQLAKACLDAANAGYAECRERDASSRPLTRDNEATFMSITIAFLYFRAIELSLKAAIRARNLASASAIRSPKKLGHDLKRLLACATSQAPNKPSYSLSDLGLTAQSKDFIERYSDDYANKWFEYHFGPNDIPPLVHLQQVSSPIVMAIKPIAQTLLPPSM
jgi:hypothetical protein